MAGRAADLPTRTAAAAAAPVAAPAPSASAAVWHQVDLDQMQQRWPASAGSSGWPRAACVERQRFTRRVDSLTASRRRHLPNVDSRVITTTAPRRRGLIKTPSPRASALSLRRAATMVSETAQNLKRDHPRPRLMETTRVDGVRATLKRLSTLSHGPCTKGSSKEGCGVSRGGGFLPTQSKTAWAFSWHPPCTLRPQASHLKP